MQRAVGIVLALVLVMVAAPVTFGGDRNQAVPDPTKEFQAYTRRALRDHFPNVALVNQDKKTVHFYDDVIKGKVVMIQFMFANCQRYCPMTTPNLVRVQKELLSRGVRDVSMVSITVDPKHDTPEVLKEYANTFHVQPGWQFLTGKKEDIDLIRRKLGVYDPDDKVNEHMNVLTMGRESTGRWLAIEALAKPDDIVYTVLLLTPHTAGKVP
jgi:cytochrome oxidase Cu insertion factor (SCO1/SenC/PrrC family)